MTKYAKAIAAGIVGFAGYVRVAYGIDMGVDDATATAIVNAAITFIVWAVPNK